MRSTFRVLTYLIAAWVAVQASATAYALFILGIWVDDSGVLDKAARYDVSTSPGGAVGFLVNSINGQLVILLLALALLVVSLLTRVPGSLRRAGAIFALVVIQVLFGLFGHSTPTLGALHTTGALTLLCVAVAAGHAMGSTTTEGPSAASSWNTRETS